MPRNERRLSRPSIRRNRPAASVPTVPSVCCIAEVLSVSGPATACTPSASTRESPKTTLECPSENQNPVVPAGRPWPTSWRAALSITAMWSASKACRAPRRKAVRPSPTPNTPALPTVRC